MRREIWLYSLNKKNDKKEWDILEKGERGNYLNFIKYKALLRGSLTSGAAKFSSSTWEELTDIEREGFLDYRIFKNFFHVTEY